MADDNHFETLDQLWKSTKWGPKDPQFWGFWAFLSINGHGLFGGELSSCHTACIGSWNERDGGEVTIGSRNQESGTLRIDNEEYKFSFADWPADLLPFYRVGDKTLGDSFSGWGGKHTGRQFFLRRTNKYLKITFLEVVDNSIRATGHRFYRRA